MTGQIAAEWTESPLAVIKLAPGRMVHLPLLTFNRGFHSFTWVFLCVCAYACTVCSLCTQWPAQFVYMCVCMCVSVWVRERKRKRDRSPYFAPMCVNEGVWPIPMFHSHEMDCAGIWLDPGDPSHHAVWFCVCISSVWTINMLPGPAVGNTVCLRSGHHM